jgi:cobalt/nickel transport system ATP-binding protein
MCHLIDSIMADADGKRTVITATHDLHIVCEIADKVIVLSEEKRVVKEARPEELFSDRPFLERHNLVHSHAHRHKNRVHTHYHDHVEHYH